MRAFVHRHESCHSVLSAVSLDTIPNTMRRDTVEMLARKDSTNLALDLRDLLGFINGNASARSKTIDVPSTTFQVWVPVDSFWDVRSMPLNAILDPRC